MKAAVYDHPGPPDVLRYADVPDPVCSSDGVLIRIEAAAIEGGDLINRASDAGPHCLPAAPGLARVGGPAEWRRRGAVADGRSLL